MKLFAWEEAFLDKISRVRAAEGKILKRYLYGETFAVFMWNSSPFVVSLLIDLIVGGYDFWLASCFTVYCFTSDPKRCESDRGRGGDQRTQSLTALQVAFATYACFLMFDSTAILRADVAFTAILIFGILRNYFIYLPAIMSKFVRARVALQRMEKFLNCDDFAARSEGLVEGAHRFSICHLFLHRFPARPNLGVRPTDRQRRATRFGFASHLWATWTVIHLLPSRCSIPRVTLRIWRLTGL